MSDYTPEHLKLWTMPQHYFGAVWPGYYVFLSQHRDSGACTRSNFTCGLAAIGGEGQDETVQVVRESHWAVGWVEWIAIHQDNSDALRKADEIMAGLSEYAVLDTEHLSNLECDELTEYWDQCSARDRADLILSEVKRYHWLKPSLMRFRRLLKADYYPGAEDGLTRDEAMVSRALEETLRQ